MEPQIREGDRLLVDIARRQPATGKLYVFWDGNGLVVKRVEMPQGDAVADDSPRLRLISANPRLRTLYLPCRGDPPRWQGHVDLVPGVMLAAVEKYAVLEYTDQIV